MGSPERTDRSVPAGEQGKALDSYLREQHLALSSADSEATRKAKEMLAADRILPSFALERSDTVREAKEELLNPNSSKADKLAAAGELGAAGINHFQDKDGRDYQITSTGTGQSSEVEITTKNALGFSRSVLKGALPASSDGHVSAGRPAEVSDWAKRNLTGSPLMSGPDTSSPAQASPEQERLLNSLRSHGINPGHPNELDRLAMIQQAKATAESSDQALIGLEVRREQGLKDLRQSGLTGYTQEWASFRDTLITDLQDYGFPAQANKLNGGTIQEADIDTIKKALDGSNTPTADKESLLADLTTFSKENDIHNVFRQEIDVTYDGEQALLDDDKRLQEAKFAHDLAEIDRLPEEQRKPIYEAFERIAANNGDGPNHLTPVLRRELIEHLAHQIADPVAIRQGNKSTSAFAAAEDFLARTAPDTYAKYATDLALTGETTLADGSKMFIDSKSFTSGPDGNAERSVVSKVFQIASLNSLLAYYAQQQGRVEGKYEDSRPQITVDPVTGRTLYDRGEWVVYPDGSRAPFGSTSDEGLAKLISAQTGRKFAARDLTFAAGAEDEGEANFLNAMKENGLPMAVNLLLRPGDSTGELPESERPAREAITVTHVDTTGREPMVYFDISDSEVDHSYPFGKPVRLRQFIRAFAVERGETRPGQRSPEHYATIPGWVSASGSAIVRQ